MSRLRAFGRSWSIYLSMSLLCFRFEETMTYDLFNNRTLWLADLLLLKEHPQSFTIRWGKRQTVSIIPAADVSSKISWQMLGTLWIIHTWLLPILMVDFPTLLIGIAPLSRHLISGEMTRSLKDIIRISSTSIIKHCSQQVDMTRASACLAIKVTKSSMDLP